MEHAQRLAGPSRLPALLTAGLLPQTVLLSLVLMLLSFGSRGQVAGHLHIQDTRSINEAPSAFNHVFRVDFKERSTVGVPGENIFSSNLTIAPWSDYSGGRIHQLNFNDGGIFYRSSSFDRLSWQDWRSLALTNPDGSLSLKGGLHLVEAPGVPDNVIGSNQEGLHHSLIGTYPGWDRGAVFIAGYNKFNSTWAHTERVRLGQKFTVNLADGSLGIGTDNTAGFALSVNGKVRASEVKVYTGWADFVFEPGYRLRPLREVEAHIKEHGRLPEVPSAQEVAAEGVDLGQTNVLLLQKIEELTLYQIELLKRLEALEREQSCRKEQAITHP
ncbi:hypothetical protein ACMA1I_22450 [Pontibacter sp. 13R65]|uniref:hypothetical protein n=1 Tax=Pontibacter sp. 13R65 TaxID=3127458 RepID=UPI00301BB5DC